VLVAATSRSYRALPHVTSLSPSTGAAGVEVVLSGYRFGDSQGSSNVTFNGTSAPAALAWSGTEVRLAAPATAATGNVILTAGGLSSTPVTFTVVGQPGGGTATAESNGGRWAQV